MTRATAHLMLLGTAVIWGLAFYFQKSAMTHVGPLLFLGLRSFVAVVALAPFAWREGLDNPLAPGRWSGIGRVSLAAGILFFAAAALQQVGLVTATVTNAGFLTGLYVVITPLLIWMVRREVPGPVVTGAIVLAFLGTWLLGGGTIGGFSHGDLLIAACALFWAIHILVTTSASQFARPILFTCLQFAIVAAISLAWAVTSEPISLSGIADAWVEVLFVGVLSSALTFTLLAMAVKVVPPAEAAILMSMETVFAALAGAIMLGERLTMVGLAGAAMMFAASLLVPLSPVVEARLGWRSGNTWR
jgi:drug/metabolite transporter (DMT)-like permease